MISIVCWRWKPHDGYRSAFGPETVNVLRAMVARHYQKPHRFICVTDDPAGIGNDVEIVPLWNDYADLKNPYGHPKNPSCYRRLRAFRSDIAEVFGPRFIQMDLDCVITGDLTPIFDRSEDFVIWGDTNPRTLYNSSLLLMTAGARAKVWDTFDPERSPAKTLAARQFGSDQGWISHCLGAGEARFTRAHGVYSYRNEIERVNPFLLPKDARIVFFHGAIDPWDAKGQSLPWVRTHYRALAEVA